MKKILLGLLIIFVIVPSVISWDADRVITGSDVIINIDNTGAEGCIIRETIPPGLDVISYEPQGGVYNPNNNYLKWIFSSCPTIVSYSTSGEGTVSGKMTSGGEEQTIAGDNAVPSDVAPPEEEYCEATAQCPNGKICNTYDNICITLQETECQIDPDCSHYYDLEGHICENYACVLVPPAQTIGQQIDQTLEGEGHDPTTKEWDLSLISKIAAILRAWFG